MNYDSLPHVLADRPHPRVQRLTLNRPEALNALTPDMHRALTEVWREIDADDSVSCVIITGAGRGFSAGGDLNMVNRMMEDFETRIRVWKEAREMVYNTAGCSKAIISAINGQAVGAGLVLALMADITIAGHSAKLIDGHTKLGVAAGDHAPIIWPLLCGMAKAKYHLMTCEPLDGVVPRVVHDDVDFSSKFNYLTPLSRCGPVPRLLAAPRSRRRWRARAGPCWRWAAEPRRAMRRRFDCSQAPRGRRVLRALKLDAKRQA